MFVTYVSGKTSNLNVSLCTILSIVVVGKSFFVL